MFTSHRGGGDIFEAEDGNGMMRMLKIDRL